jgi:hypothetical protein
MISDMLTKLTELDRNSSLARPVPDRLETSRFILCDSPSRCAQNNLDLQVNLRHLASCLLYCTYMCMYIYEEPYSPSGSKGAHVTLPRTSTPVVVITIY